MLSKRLQAVAKFIDKKDNLIDVGCDHGYLGIYLKTNNLVNTILLTDVNKNALSNAISNIKNFNLNIPTILTNGLEDVATNQYDTISLSGMGTSTIKKILNPNKLSTISKIIIQSNNNLFELRAFLKTLGYRLVDEITLQEKNIWYVVCLFKKGVDSSKFFKYGITKKDKILYYKYLINNYQKILKNIPIKDMEIRKQYLNEIDLLNKLLEEC